MTVDRVSASGRLAIILSKAGQMDGLLTPATLTAANEETFRLTFAELRTAVIDLGEAIGEREQVSTFAEFFSNVGDSLVQAQRALDAHTQTYLQEVSGNATLLPAVFRIPTLSADIRFGLEKTSQDRLNIIFHSRGSEARELNQQSVHFEIIAAPPPPGAIDGDGARPWRPAFIVSPSERAVILAAFEIAANVAEVKAPEKKVFLEEVLPNADEILIVEDDQEGRYFLALARGDDPKNVGVWYLIVKPPTITPAYRYTRAPLADELAGMRELHRKLSAACTAQRTLLQKLRAQPR